jgi:uncharacterized protein YbjT (DUF2867 family)
MAQAAAKKVEDPKSAPKKLIVVAGATGAQGGSVLQHLHKDGTFAIRVITRSKTGEKAQALVKKYPGIEVAGAELTDRKSMVEALTGAHGFFLVTQFWEKMDEKDEIKQGTNAIDAAIDAGVKHIVFSSLPGCDILTDGKIHVAHFDGKWRISQYLALRAKAAGIVGAPFAYTNLFVPYYFDNLQHPWFGPHQDEKGRFVFTYGLSGRGLAGFAVGDTGGPVVPIFKDTAGFNEKLVDFYGEVLTITKMVETFTRVTGKAAVADDKDTKSYAAVPNVNKEIAAMWAADAAIDENRHKAGWTDPYTKPLGLKSSDYVQGNKLYPALNFEQWLKQSGFQQSAPAKKN